VFSQVSTEFLARVCSAIVAGRRNSCGSASNPFTAIFTLSGRSSRESTERSSISRNKEGRANSLPRVLADSTRLSSANEAGALKRDDLDAFEIRSVDSYYDVRKIREIEFQRNSLLFLWE